MSNTVERAAHVGGPSPNYQVTDPEFIVDGLVQAIDSPAAVALVPLEGRAPGTARMHRWVADGVGDDMVERVLEVVEDRLREGRPLGSIHAPLGSGWRVWAEPVRTGPEEPVGALVVAHRSSFSWSEGEVSLVRAFAAMGGCAWDRAALKAESAYQRSLDELVVRVAERLMPVSVATLHETLDWAVRELAEFLNADVAFLRSNDHANGVSVLMAEYPVRDNVPDPDPLAVVPFDADPIFAALRDLKEPMIGRQSQTPDDYNERVKDASGVEQFAGVVVPLMRGGVTIACLGFLHFHECSWTTPEVNALQAVASMLVQLNARIEAEENLQRIALHDELTGLPNRRALLAELDRRVEHGRGRTALVFVDLDRFKVMNDYLGHVAGDHVLLTIADRLRLSVRPSDFAARLGGDEFVILMDGENGELGALASANRLLELLAEPIEVNGQLVSHTASIGISLTSGSGSVAVDMLGQADVALYSAKSSGGNRAVIFDDSLRVAVAERSSTELALREAIEHDGLRLFYQPEIDLRTGAILAVEALIRYEHPTRGILPAGSFIGVAEETGLVVDLGYWVIEEACRQLAAWRLARPSSGMVVRLNMSPAQLAMSGIVDYVERCLSQACLPGDALCIEITEHAVIQDVEQAVRTLDDFRSLGVTLALDDFGTGFSSMAQLKRLPVDTLKIDTSFVSGMAHDPSSRTIVEAIIRLGSAFGLETVAEGVEVFEDLEALRALHCYRAQGFLLARPMSASDIEPILARGGIDLPDRTFAALSSN